MKYFIADLHLAHPKLAEHRGFDSMEEHDAAILASLEGLQKSDQLWVLGDVSSGSSGSTTAALEQLAQLRSQLHPAVGFHLITGNHDRCHPMHRDAHKHQAAYLAVFDSVAMVARTRIEGREWLLSHHPYTGDHSSEDRHVQYRLRDLGAPLIHGHTHSETRVDGNQVCVSWEAWRRPVSEQEIGVLAANMPPAPVPADVGAGE